MSELYLTTTGRLVGVSGTAVLFNVTQDGGTASSALAVNYTVRTIGAISSQSGAEYTLAGTSTGQSYSRADLPDGIFQDATTDGTFNYLWDFSSGTAYRLSLSWADPVPLFSLGTAEGVDFRAGITYDPSNNSLWISGVRGPHGDVIADYSLDGRMLSSFKIGHLFSYSLALDPADGTLWLSNGNASVLTLEQYARTATGAFDVVAGPLNVQTYPGLSRDAGSGEFQRTTAVPEPSDWTLLSCGGVTLAAIKLRARGAFPTLRAV